jgi:predicted Zn finger-like uncharacterized protein
MNIRCPECRTIFRVDPARIPPAGVRARCSRCSTTFRVSRDAADAATTPPPAPAGPPAETARAAAAAAIETAASVVSGIAEAIAGRAEPDADSSGARGGEPAAPTGQPTDAIPETETPPTAAEPSAERAQPAEAAPPQPPAPAAAPHATQPAEAAPPRPPAEPVRPPQPVEAERRLGLHAQPQLFGTRDPDARAQRIARALISDIVAYHPQRREEALAKGTLRTDFREEIMKSWEEYVAQVGLETARSTPHFRNALNQILALGQPVF